MSKLWRFDVITSGTLSDCERLLELPYSSNFNVGQPVASCFIEGSIEEANSAAALARGLGFEVHPPERVPAENWVAKCSAMWQPVKAGDLNIIPVIDESTHSRNGSPGELYIVPGSGFGTGHHPSTFAALCLMQDRRILNTRPATVLDVGAGSAILSIAAVKLYGSEAFAYDVDQHALDNAESCIALNPETRPNIHLYCSALPDDAPRAQLILANIYGEILIESAPLFKSRLMPSGHVILAGVTSEISQAVQDTFTSLGFRLLEHKISAEWNAFLFELS